MDEFLGQVTLPLNEMDAYERPRPRWFKLQSKPGKEKKDKDRGDLEVRVAFTVKAGSLTDLSKKEKNKSSTLGLGGSLLSLNAFEKRKSLKKFAKSMGSKMHISGKKKDKHADADSISSSISSLSTTGTTRFEEANRRFSSTQAHGDADPGVISEDDDEFAFDNLSNKSSVSSINLRSKGLQSTQYTPSPLATHPNYAKDNEAPKTPVESLRKSVEPAKRDSAEVDEWEAKLYGKHMDSNYDSLKRTSWGAKRFEPEIQAADKQDTNPFEKPDSNPFENDDDADSNVSSEKPATPNQMHTSVPTVVVESNNMQPIELPVKEKKEKFEKRLANKWKNFRKELEDSRQNHQQKQIHERIIIGHENDILMGHKQIEVPPALLKRYEGKSREVSYSLLLFFALFVVCFAKCRSLSMTYKFQEVILHANDLENEVRIQKIRMKEMEEYLDDLLLRVMETQPKLLQNPYRTHASVKR